MCLSSCDHGFLFPVCRVVRVIRQPRGNMLLIGVGGSGRQSLSRLASYIISYNVFQIEVTRHYRLQEFREGSDIKVGLCSGLGDIFMFYNTSCLPYPRLWSTFM